MSSPPKKVTYNEIAELSGVSIATVSRVFKQPELVKEATVQRVMDAMRRLQAATEPPALPHGECSRNILLISSDISNPMLALIVNGIKSSASQQMFELLIYDNNMLNTTDFDSLFRLIRCTNVAGIITLSPIQGNVLSAINEIVPVVQCCEFNPDLDLPYVTINDTLSAKQAVNHLLNAGRDRIAMVNCDMRYGFAKLRYEGYCAALQDAGVPFNPYWMINLPQINFNMAMNTITALLDKPDRPNALFCVSDVYAAAAVRACIRLGLRVPQDVMVVGFDNVDIATITSPTITTISQPKFELGFAACEMLKEKIANPTLLSGRTILETELVVRESTMGAEG